MFITNVGTTDRIVRIVIGILALAYAYFHPAGIGMWIAGIVGVMMILTALMRTCPAYSLLGTSTCKLVGK